MFDTIKILGVLLVQRVVSQMSEVVLRGPTRLGQLRDIVFFTGKTDQTIVIQEYGERVHHTRN